MERAAAIKKLGKLLGKSLGYRVNPRAPSCDERVAARHSLPALTEEKKKCEEAMRARREAILAADQEYQALLGAHKKAREAWERAASITHQYRFTVGTSNGIFFHVKAQGDSWEQVIDIIAKAESKS